MKKTLTIGIFLFLMFCILTNSAQSLKFAANGLQLWLDKMVPALLPFMILSGTLIRTGLTEGFTTLVYPVVKPVFRVRPNVCYVMLMGFMCGFPMGAKCVGDMYLHGKLTKREAEYLLAFCNNIGPVYFVSFVLPLIGCSSPAYYLFGMYGLPLLYGLVLRYTVYADLSAPSDLSDHANTNFHQSKQKKTDPIANEQASPVQPLLPALDESIRGSVQSMLMLGGYMILFDLLMLIPYLYWRSAYPYLAPFLEITGGLAVLGADMPIYSLVLLPFGGLSCLAQTYSCIKDTGLSLADHVCHKAVLTAGTVCYYLLLRLLRLL